MSIKPTRAQISAGRFSMDSRIDPAVAEDLGMTTPDNFPSHVESGSKVRKILGMVGTTNVQNELPPAYNSKDGVGYFADPDTARGFAAAWRSVRPKGGIK